MVLGVIAGHFYVATAVTTRGAMIMMFVVAGTIEAAVAGFQEGFHAVHFPVSHLDLN